MPVLPLDWQGLQSMLHAAGVGAQRVEGLWWLMFWVFAAIWLAVVAAALGALRRRAAPRAVRWSRPPRAR
ncbi:hypothetical protein ABXN37_13435 [Piscinibacter sakaiensis]|uniref:hypothetical protein n=1 Tax=Piscinibacter sakaiensis TaxID=1547922 RepID=UPI003727410C